MTEDLRVESSKEDEEDTKDLVAGKVSLSVVKADLRTDRLSVEPFCQQHQTSCR